MSELPAGWRLVTLGNIVEPRPSRVMAKPEDDRPYLSMEHVEADTTRVLGSGRAGDMKSACMEFDEGDVLYGRLRPYLNKVCRPTFGGLASAEFITFRDFESVEPAFLKYFLSQPAFVSFASRINEGDRPRVKWSQIRSFELGLPSLREQRLIVEVIEEQFSRLDAGVESLQRAKGNLVRLHSAIAQDALGEHDHGISKRVSLGQLGEMGRGKSRHRPRNAPFLYGGPYPFIQTGDIANSGGRITHHVQTYSEEGLAQSRLWPAGTVCITIAANIAESALLTYPACFPDSVVGIITDPALVVPEYLEYFIRTAKANMSAFAPATAQKNINLSILNQVGLSLPPLEVQREIVAEVERQFSIIDAMAKTIDTGLARAGALRRSILSQAFSGKLTGAA